MAQPTAYNRQTNFSNEQALNPSTKTPGDQLDAELNAVKVTTDEIRQNLALIQRDDGALANSSVGRDQLSADVSLGFNAPSAWVSPTSYTQRDTVFYSAAFYRCIAEHVSSSFNRPDVDVAGGTTGTYWALIANFGNISFLLNDGDVTGTKIADLAVGGAKIANGAVSDVKLASDAVSTGKLVDGAVTAAKIADGAVTTAKIASGVVTADKLSQAYALSGHTHVASQITDFDESVDDRVGALIAVSTGLIKSYNDVGNTLNIGLGTAASILTYLGAVDGKASGYYKFPGGLIVQWGTGNGGTAVVFPTAFTAVPKVMVVPITGVQPRSVGLNASPSTTGFTPRTFNTTTGAETPTGVEWFSIGY